MRKGSRRDSDHSRGVLLTELQTGEDKPADGSKENSEYCARHDV